MKQITVAIIGMGSRGANAYACCQKKFPEKMRIVAVADPDEEKRRIAREEYGVSPDMLFETAEQLLRREKLADVAFICTPDSQHYAQACRALELGYDLLLEKPISNRPEQCAEIARLAEKKGRQVVVCHVLRYTPFYREIKRMLDAGEIGTLVSVQAIEKVCYWHQAHSFVRGNWRNSDLSSPMILQKCCHDMNIFLWLTGKHCKKVSSFGSLTYFRPENAPENAAERCLDCGAKDACPYNAERFYMDRLRDGGDWPVNVLHPAPTEENISRALREGPYGRCVFRCDNNVVDHQVVNLLMEDGVTVNFTMCAFTAKGGRQIRLMGTQGEIVGDMEANEIRLCPFGREEQVVDVRTLASDFSGHGGGDVEMVREFLDLTAGEVAGSALTSVDRSVESHMVAFAAEKSRLNQGACVDMQAFETES